MSPAAATVVECSLAIRGVFMHHHHVKYLIAGGGLAASAAARTIRQIDSVSPLLMVGQEIHRPYHRSPLSKDFLLRPGRLQSAEQRQELFTLSPEWFAQNDVDLQTGRRIERLDVARRAATLDNGEEVSYDALLLASGAVPRRLDIGAAELPNVFYLRTLADAERIGNAIEKARAEGLRHDRDGGDAVGGTGAGSGIAGPVGGTGRGAVVVIGGGVLGVEVAATLSQLGLAVSLLVGREYPWRRFAGASAGHAVQRLLTSAGAAVHADRRAVRLEGDGRVQRVIADDGRAHACDFVVAAVGTTIPRDLLRGTPIAAETAILTDDRCRTSEEHIWAAGDCAAIFDPRFGKHRVVDHASHAIATGTLAGINMAGGEARYGQARSGATGGGWAPHADGWTTTLLGRSASVVGEPRLVYRWIVRGNAAGDDPHFAEIGVAVDGRVAQVLCFGDDAERAPLAELVDRRADVSGHEEALKDRAAPLPAVR